MHLERMVAALIVALVSRPAQTADLVRRSSGSSTRQRQTTVLPGLERHPALARLDLQFCGTGSEGQISRGPLGCGFPVVGDHPWLVALGFSAPDGHTLFACSGALVSDQHVVTSARCALGAGHYRLTTARLGEYDFASRRDCLWYAPDLCTESQDVAVGGVAVHPDFVRRGGDASASDVAVVLLARPVRLQHGVLPICLPLFPERPPPHRQVALTLGLHAGPPPAPRDGTATCCQCDRDRSATSHVMDAQRLGEVNSSYTGGQPCQYRLLSAEPAEPGAPGRCLGAGTPCLADLGAPLVAADRFGSAYYLLGVASVRPAQSECRRPGATVTYAPIQEHVPWILDTFERLKAGSS